MWTRSTQCLERLRERKTYLGMGEKMLSPARNFLMVPPALNQLCLFSCWALRNSLLRCFHCCEVNVLRILQRNRGRKSNGKKFEKHFFFNHLLFCWCFSLCISLFCIILCVCYDTAIPLMRPLSNQIQIVIQIQTKLYLLIFCFGKIRLIYLTILRILHLHLY